MKDRKQGWLRVRVLAAALVLPLNGAVPSPMVAEAAGARRVAVILVVPPGAAPPFSVEEASELVFGELDSAAALIWEMSSGREWLEGHVFGSYPMAYSGGPTECPDMAWAAEGAALAAADGYDTDAYALTIYVFPWEPRCVYGGRAHDRRTVFINGYLDEAGHVAHEILHCAGLGHADALLCTERVADQVVLSSRPRCRVLAYGDPNDVMGGAAYFRPHHLSAVAKALLGWLDAENVATVTLDGVYMIAPHEQIRPGRVHLLRIPRGAGWVNHLDEAIYVEFRQPFGVDDWDPVDPVVNGILMHLSAPLSADKEGTDLLDMHPETATLADAALGVGETFADPLNGITVTLLAVSPDGATVEVRIVPVGGAVGLVNGTLTFSASPGVRNRVRVRVSGGSYVLVDAGEVLRDADGPGGCEVHGRQATCPAAGVTDLRIATGDQRDSVRLSVAIPADVDAGEGDDTVDGGRGDDHLSGGPGRDSLAGDGGNDTLHGGPGNDRLRGESGEDRYFGDEDDDTIRSRDGIAETVSCGPGKDSALADATDELVDCAP
jgi:hypothetical protein